MIYIGIDFSLNSPGVCIKRESGEYQFITFFNYGNRVWGEKTPKAFQIHKELIDDNIIGGIPYSRVVDNKDFIEKERQKIQDADSLSELIINILVLACTDDACGKPEIKICLEGFSYGSKGNSFIDIILYNSLLRKKLKDCFGVDNIYIYQPSAVKKLAGKGNANKHYMVDAFQKNVLQDVDLAKSKFWEWCKDKDYSKTIPKPIDDLIDSYFILQSGLKDT
jgi:hypothetical protein